MSKYRVYLSKSNSALNSDTEKIRAELEKLDIEIVQHQAGSNYNKHLVGTCNFLIIIPPYNSKHQFGDYVSVGKGQSDQIDSFGWFARAYVARLINDKVTFQEIAYKSKLEIDWVSKYAGLTCTSTRNDLVDLVLLHKNQLSYKTHKAFKTPEELVEKVKPTIKEVLEEKLSGKKNYAKGRTVVDDAFTVAGVLSPTKPEDWIVNATKPCWNGSVTIPSLVQKAKDDVVKQLADKIRRVPRKDNTDKVMLACSLLID